MRRTLVFILAILTSGSLWFPQATEANDPNSLYVNGVRENISSGGTVRVAMRAAPSAAADVICRIYNGIEVEQLEQEAGGFIKIRLGNTEGYMMSKYLAKSAQRVHMPNSAYASIEIFGNETEVALYSDASFSHAEQSFKNPMSAIVYAIAEDWAYVQPLSSGRWEVVGKPGYISADCVLETQNFKNGWVAPVVQGDTLKLYATPSEQSQLLGEYYKDVNFWYMFWESTITDWRKVRFGHTVGYVKKGNYISGFPAEISSLQTMHITAPQAQLKLRPDDQGETLLTLEQGTQVYVMGFVGEWYHVQTAPFVQEAQYGYLHNKDLSR